MRSWIADALAVLALVLCFGPLLFAADCTNGALCQCGDTIPAGVTVALDHNLYCPSVTPSYALNVKGTLRCNQGQVISGSRVAGKSGVVLSNTSAAVIGCRIAGFENGVYASGRSAVKAIGIEAWDNIGHGVFYVDGQTNQVANSSLHDNYGSGIRYRGGNRHTVNGVTSINNRDSGVRFSNVSNSTVRNSNVAGNWEWDMLFTDGSYSSGIFDSVGREIYFQNQAHDNIWCNVSFPIIDHDSTTNGSNHMSCP